MKHVIEFDELEFAAVLSAVTAATIDLKTSQAAGVYSEDDDGLLKALCSAGVKLCDSREMRPSSELN